MGLPAGLSAPDADTVPVFTGRWRSADHIGPAKPRMYVEYRTGRIMHGYAPWHGSPVRAFVAGGYVRQRGEAAPSGWPVTGYGRLYWQNTWTPDAGDDGVWRQLPNCAEFDVQHNLQNNGIAVLTLTVENIAYPELTGPLGVYHSIKRGYYAPKRGYVPAGQPRLTDASGPVAKEAWYGKLNQSGQIRPWVGYGDLLVPLGPFLIDDIDTESHPDRITITARDHGQVLTDMRIFGWNKEPRILDPMVMRDRREADNERKVGYNYRASSSADGHPVSLAADHGDSDSYWLSDAHGGRNFTEWIQLHVPAGRYEELYFYPRQRGYEIFVSVYSRNSPGRADGWVDLGHGDVPGANGGVPYVHHRKGLDNKAGWVSLKDVYHLGKGSTIRVSIRHLASRPAGYAAGANALFANKRADSSDARKHHHVLVDDVSDMVRVVLRWAGFKEWDVETSGVRLKERQVFPRSAFYFDVIKKAMELTGYQFFMKAGTGDDDSIGIPCFRRPLVVDERIRSRAVARDTDLLEGIKTKDSDENKAYIIRVRGKTAKESKGGLPLSGDRSKRLMFVYRPPWWRKLGGIVKHVVFTNNAFKTVDDCKFACYFIALQEALESDKGTCQIPILPGFEVDGARFGLDLDSHLSVRDVGTGLVTRLWISGLQLSFRQAEQPRNTMTVDGALADTRDIRTITQLIDKTPRGNAY